MAASALLSKLIECGYKASKIAKVCREKPHLFKILVQEKGVLSNNSVDFKTLADVFIQQVIKKELEGKVNTLVCS